MSEQVRLSDEERRWLQEVTSTVTDGLWAEEDDPLLFAVVESILTARLASESRALAEARKRLAACGRLFDHHESHSTDPAESEWPEGCWVCEARVMIRAALGDPS